MRNILLIVKKRTEVVSENEYEHLELLTFATLYLNLIVWVCVGPAQFYVGLL